jgi:hypothetical protein
VIFSLQGRDFRCIRAQEKQFVAATEVSNMKHRTGKYCSARWKAMAPEEKRLYLILEQTGSK